MWTPWTFKQGAFFAGTTYNQAFEVDVPNTGASPVQAVVTDYSVGCTAAASTLFRTYIQVGPSGAIIYANEQTFTLGAGAAQWHGWVPVFGNSTWSVYINTSTTATCGFVLSGYIFSPG